MEQICASILSAPLPDEAAIAAERGARERANRKSMFDSFIGARDRYRNCRLDEWTFSASYDAQQRKVIAGVGSYIAKLRSEEHTSELQSH